MAEAKLKMRPGSVGCRPLVFTGGRKHFGALAAHLFTRAGFVTQTA